MKCTLLLLSLLIVSCDFANKKEVKKAIVTPTPSVQTVDKAIIISVKDDSTSKEKRDSKKVKNQIQDSVFVLLKNIDNTFLYDLKYATTDNFLKEKVYECADCLLRYKTVIQLLKAHEEFKALGYRIKFYDCYRPLTIQKKMWGIMPDKRYVANPEKGSNHNRGTAVDITLVDSLGNELAMGTPFDYFGRKAHHTYQNLPEKVLNNRKILKSIMEKHGFWSITSEWWHYNLTGSQVYNISDFKTVCE